MLVVVLALCLLVFAALFAWKAHEASTNDSDVSGSPSNPVNPPDPPIPIP